MSAYGDGAAGDVVDHRGLLRHTKAEHEGLAGREPPLDLTLRESEAVAVVPRRTARGERRGAKPLEPLLGAKADVRVPARHERLGGGAILL